MGKSPVLASIKNGTLTLVKAVSLRGAIDLVGGTSVAAWPAGAADRQGLQRQASTRLLAVQKAESEFRSKNPHVPTINESARVRSPPSSVPGPTGARYRGDGATARGKARAGWSAHRSARARRLSLIHI